MKKRLVFFCYWFKDAIENEANICHFQCLSHYGDIFDEIIFCISVKDTEDYELINDCKARVLKIFPKCKNLTFKVYQNDALCECTVFKSEIVDKLKILDGFTFFAHNKGTTNVVKDKYDKESILKWIRAMYYFNCEFSDEMENFLGNYIYPCFYGSFLETSEIINNRFNAWYAGTFYWLNAQKIYNIYKDDYPDMYDRRYAEMFPGNLFTTDFGTPYLISHDMAVLYCGTDYYHNSEKAIRIALSSDNIEIEKWKKYNELVSKISIN